MAAHDGAKPWNQILTILSVLLGAVFLLPGVAPSLFGWAQGFTAIPVFSLLCLYGTKQGTIVVRNGAILATVGAIIFHQLPNTLNSLTLIPLGFSFYRSATVKENEILTAFKGFIVLGICWIVFWFAHGTINEINPYNQLLQILDNFIVQTYELYKSNSQIPTETLVNAEQAVAELRAIIPKILPGILFCTVLITVWINLLVSITLLERIKPGVIPWKKYRDWRLPDRLVWIPIAAGFALFFGNGSFSAAGLSILMASVLIYFFQGLAVLINYLDRLKVPLYFKVLTYGILILIFQSFGLLLLSVIGFADVWIDFRHRHRKNNQEDN